LLQTKWANGHNGSLTEFKAAGSTPEVLFLVCLSRRMALEKPKAKLTRLFRPGDLFQ
jgi:hypothetical protein